MRLWSLHPSLLDRVGLVALWREALLAQKVLAGRTRGYRHHPQLDRFRQTRDPARAIAIYLWSVADEAKVRGYHFDISKIARSWGTVSIPVAKGQLAYELTHLERKLVQRDPKQLQSIRKCEPVKVNPTFKAVEGPIEPWERTAAVQTPQMRALPSLVYSNLPIGRRQGVPRDISVGVRATRFIGKVASSRRLMSDRWDFEIVCPNNHDQTVTFSQDEFEGALKSGTLVFHCNTCDTDWPPSHEDIAKCRKQFAKNSS